MPIDLGSSIKKTSQWAFGSPVLNTLLSNSIVVGLVISIIMILIVMAIYPAKKGTKFSLVFKMFFYMFLSSSIIIFLHDGIIKYMFDEQNKNNDHEDVLRGMNIQDRNYIFNEPKEIPIKNNNEFDELNNAINETSNIVNKKVTDEVITGGNIGKLKGIKASQKSLTRFK